MLFAVVAAALSAVTMPAASRASATEASFTNPLPIAVPGQRGVESCADPSVIRGQAPDDPYWYLFCTTDPLNEDDRDASGAPYFRLIPISRSLDLVTWTYIGAVFTEQPAWAGPDAGLWAPSIHYLDGLYHLYYAANQTVLPGGGSAIGVATSTHPAGPWTDSGGPVVEPQALAGQPDATRAVLDPFVLQADGERFLFYGSFAGGISARRLSADGLRTDPQSEVLITIANRYEAPLVVPRGGYYYLFVSAAGCCNGPLSGYGVFAGRAVSPLGPYFDREGVPLLGARVGGTPVLNMNGNRWVGPGHIEVVTGLGGQDWALYHAIDRDAPYFASPRDLTRRPVLLDTLDWVDGWPLVRGGLGPSDAPQAAPVTLPGGRDHRPVVRALPDEAGELVHPHSEEFDDDILDPSWSWVRPPDEALVEISGGVLRLTTQDAELYEDTDTASLLTVAAPAGDYLIETRVALSVPPEGCCYNNVQAGLVVYGDDDRYLKLVHVATWETRQTEFAIERQENRPGYPRYGGSVVGPPADWTYLRVVKRAAGDGERYTAYTSRDGVHWVRGGTWSHQLGADARIGLAAMNRAGFAASFDYLRVYSLAPES